MPFIDILPSIPGPSEAEVPAFVARVAAITARSLGKPESVMMVRLSPASTMQFAGTDGPCCFVDVRVIGTPGTDAAHALNAALSSEMEVTLGIPAARVFVVFTDVSRSSWGVGGRMLG